jgi:hypothetical protein
MTNFSFNFLNNKFTNCTFIVINDSATTVMHPVIGQIFCEENVFRGNLT